MKHATIERHPRSLFRCCRSHQFRQKKTVLWIPRINEFHTRRCCRRVIWGASNQTFVGEAVGEIQTKRISGRSMASTARTTFIKDILLNIMICRVFIRCSLPKTVADPNEVQNIDDPVAIYIRILLCIAIPSVAQRTQRQALSLGCSRSPSLLTSSSKVGRLPCPSAEKDTPPTSRRMNIE